MISHGGDTRLGFITDCSRVGDMSDDTLAREDGGAISQYQAHTGHLPTLNYPLIPDLKKKNMHFQD